MGEVTLVTDVMPVLAPMVRTPGLHVSTIIHSLAVALGHYTPSSDDNTAGMEAGSALEYGLIHRLYDTFPGRFYQPGELRCDNILLTPDLFDLEQWCVDEFKLSSITVRHDPRVNGDGCPACDGAPGPCRKFWKWWVQGAAYCKPLASTRVRLRVLFERGDYRGNARKQYREYLQVFTEDEIEANWAMLVQHGETLRCPSCAGTGWVDLHAGSVGCSACDGKGINVYK